MLIRVFEIWVRQGSLIIEGPEHWVTVTGEIGPDDTFYAEGSGMVAGYPDIAVTFTGTISMDQIQDDYIMGAKGGLPGGKSITYLVEGVGTKPEGAAMPELDFEEIYAFFSSLNVAQFNSDVQGMLSMLHPAVVERYGSEACQAYLSANINPDVLIESHDAAVEANWDWISDRRSTIIDNAYAIEVIVLINGNEDPQTAYLARRSDGWLTWFTDCGDPLP